MSFKQFTQELTGNRVEGELIKTVFISLISSLFLLVIIYYLKLQYITNFIPKYGFHLIFALLSFALIIPAIRQVRAYRQFNCMSGMMVGMTIGMISGFLPGFYIGATNGMFIGSMFGMFIGITLGIWNGKCCGIMGIMEGIMAGFMGGLMGAMSSVMMINEHLIAAGGIVFFVSAAISLGLNYMIYKDFKESERTFKEDQFITIIISLILTAITTWLMVFGPRSALFS